MSQKCHTIITSDNFTSEPTVKSFTQMMELDFSGSF
jgi:hypothetical protein